MRPVTLEWCQALDRITDPLDNDFGIPLGCAEAAAPGLIDFYLNVGEELVQPC